MAAPPIKPVSMASIKSRLLRPALTSHFICEFKPPEAAKNFLNLRTGAGFVGATYNSENQELLQLSCSEASLPGSSLATNEINNDYTGVTERHAYRRLYDDRSDFTFYVDGEYRIIDFFENWISYVVNENDLKAQRTRTYNYRVNFPQGPGGYQTDDLYITKFEKNHTRPDRGRPLVYKFIGAYPISINSMPVSYDSSQLLKCTVSFTYSRYVISRTGTFSTENGEQASSNPNSPGNPELNRSTLATAAERYPSLTYSQRAASLEGDEIISAINSFNQPIQPQ